MQGKHVLLMSSILLTSTLAMAAGQQMPGCHQLLTEKECAEHQSRLASLSSAEAREHYLAEYETVRRERERFCHCANVPAGWTRMPQKHAILSF